MCQPPPDDGFARSPGLRLAPVASELARVDVWWSCIAGKAGIPADVRNELLVCLHELIGNIVMHGGEGVTFILLDATRAGGRIALTVADDGVAFDPTTVPAPVLPSSLEDARIGGLGLLLVRRFSDELRYQRVGGCNYITIFRHIDTIAPEDG